MRKVEKPAQRVGLKDLYVEIGKCIRERAGRDQGGSSVTSRVSLDAWGAMTDA